MHTTASDGRCSPAEVVARADAAGLTTFAITDHDTVAALAEARPLAAARGLELVPGIEITAVWDARDVHVLGYWCDEHDASLLAFLAEQRARRIERVEQIARVLARAGAPIDVTPLIDDALARPGAAVGRPGVARLLVEAGHSASTQDAFDRLLGEGRPAYVARQGVPPEAVCAIVHAAGGLASLAHPGVTRRDDMIERWVRGGLDALEAFHSDHSDAVQAACLEAAARLGVAVSGGSDFHGDDPAASRYGRRVVGGVTLPAAHWTGLVAAHAARRS